MTTLVNFTGGPGTFTITADAANAITLAAGSIVTAMEAQTILIQGIPGSPDPGTLVQIDANLFAILQSLNHVAEASLAISGTMKKIDTSLGILTSMQASGNALQATMVANQVQTNNYQVAATKQTLERTGQPAVVVPSVEEQIKESVIQSVTVSQLAIASGAVSAQVTAGFAGMATYVTESGPYKTVKGWLEDAIEYAAVPFKSAWATVKETAAKIGTKSV
jgi:hypothetical protein